MFVAIALAAVVVVGIFRLKAVLATRQHAEQREFDAAAATYARLQDLGRKK